MLLIDGAWRDFGNIVSASSSEVKGIGNNIVDLMLVVLGIAGIIATVRGFIQYNKSDQGSEHFILKVGIGTVLAVMLIFGGVDIL